MDDVLQVAESSELAVSPDDRRAELDALKNEIALIRTSIADEIAARRQTARATLWCEWAGQSPDGRKRGDVIGEDAEPFEGASDNRVRLTEQIASEQKRQLVLAASRATPKAVAIESGDASAAARIETLLKWIVRTQWGSDYRRCVELLAWYHLVDTPAGALCMVDWEREFSIQMTEVTAENLIAMQLAVVDGEATPEAVQNASALVYDPDREAELVAMLLAVYPEMRESRAKKAAKELYETRKASIPEKYARVNMPVIAPLRLYWDVFFPANTTDVQRASVIIRRKWMTKPEVLEAAATNGWSEEFVEKLVGNGGASKGQEGISAWDDADGERVIANTGEANRHAGTYEVLWAYRKMATPDGALAIYVTTFSGMLDVTAKPTELFDRRHGKYPFVYFPREILTERLIDSRGIPEVFQTNQQTVKLLKDSFEDHVQVTLQPPLMGPENPRYTLQFGPKAYLPKSARSSYEYLNRPPYPQAADRYWMETRREINEASGRPGADVDPGLVQLAMQDRVDRFLASLSDVFMMVVQLCQEFMTDEDLQRVVGGAGMPVARSVKEIQGKYDIALSFDVRDMDMAGVLEKAKVILENIKPLDVRAILPYEQIVARLLASIDPNLADMVASVEEADAREIASERANFVSMLNGVEPEMPDGGINAELRLQVLQQLIGERQTNPGAYPPVSPIAQAMVENRMKYLTFQMEQTQNAAIGRTGTKPVQPGDVAAGGAGAEVAA